MRETSLEHSLALSLVNALFATDRKRLYELMYSLMDDNANLLGVLNQRTSIRFQNHIILSRPPTRLIGTRVKSVSLHPSLQERARYVTSEIDVLNEHRQKIKQMLCILLKGWSDAQSVRDTLPDCLAQYLPMRLERSKPQRLAWALTDRQIAEYDEILPLIQMYSASQLLL